MTVLAPHLQQGLQQQSPQPQPKGCISPESASRLHRFTKLAWLLASIARCAGLA